MTRKFKNEDLILPNGEKARIGVWQGPEGEMCVKLRLPTDYWSVTGVFRAAAPSDYKDGKTVITLDYK